MTVAGSVKYTEVHQSVQHRKQLPTLSNSTFHFNKLLLTDIKVYATRIHFPTLTHINTSLGAHLFWVGSS